MRLNKLLTAVCNGSLYKESRKLLELVYRVEVIRVEVIRGDVYRTRVCEYVVNLGIKNFDALEIALNDEIIESYKTECFARLNDTQYTVMVEGVDRYDNYRMFIFRSVEDETDKTEYTDVTDI